MDCKQYRAGVEGDGDFAGVGPAAARSHAAACAACRVFSDESAALRGLVSGLARVDAPPDFEFRLRARAACAAAARARSWTGAIWPRAAWLAAGCLAFAAPFVLRTHDTRPTPVPSAGALRETEPAKTAGGVGQPRLAGGDEEGESWITDPRAAKAEQKAFGAARRGRRIPAAAVIAAAGPPRSRAAGAAGTLQLPAAVATPAGAVAKRTESSTMSMTGSPVVVSTAMPLPAAAGGPPLRVMFKDMQGESRVVSVDPLAFGSGEQAARPASVTYTKAAKKQGVW